MDKSGKVATLMFIVLMILPLLALLMMDYQVRMANDITGAFIGTDSDMYSAENMMTAGLVLGFILLAVFVFVSGRLKDSRLMSSMPHARMNKHIKSIDEHLKNK